MEGEEGGRKGKCKAQSQDRADAPRPVDSYNCFDNRFVKNSRFDYWSKHLPAFIRGLTLNSRIKSTSIGTKNYCSVYLGKTQVQFNTHGVAIIGVN